MVVVGGEEVDVNVDVTGEVVVTVCVIESTTVVVSVGVAAILVTVGLIVIVMILVGAKTSWVTTYKLGGAVTVIVVGRQLMAKTMTFARISNAHRPLRFTFIFSPRHTHHQLIYYSTWLKLNKFEICLLSHST